MRSAAMDEFFAGTHQPLRRTPSELWNSTSSYPNPTDAGVAHGSLRLGLVIQSTTSHPAPRYPISKAARRASMLRGLMLILQPLGATGSPRSSSPRLLRRARR